VNGGYKRKTQEVEEKQIFKDFEKKIKKWRVLKDCCAMEWSELLGLG